MKIATLVVSMLLVAVTTFSQSKSYRTLSDKFRGQENVFQFKTSGFLARFIIGLAGEHEFTEAIRDVKNIRLITIPQETLKEAELTLKGFARFAKKDSFEELAHFHDNGDDVTFLMQSGTNGNDNRYLVLIDGSHEIVVLEIKGFVDPDKLLINHKQIAYDNL
jgi:hypothetical protein